jgi:hypothetical protein
MSPFLAHGCRSHCGRPVRTRREPTGIPGAFRWSTRLARAGVRRGDGGRQPRGVGGRARGVVGGVLVGVNASAAARSPVPPRREPTIPGDPRAVPRVPPDSVSRVSRARTPITPLRWHTLARPRSGPTPEARGRGVPGQMVAMRSVTVSGAWSAGRARGGVSQRRQRGHRAARRARNDAGGWTAGRWEVRYGAPPSGGAL